MFHFLSSSYSLSKRRGNLHKQTNPTQPWREAAKHPFCGGWPPSEKTKEKLVSGVYNRRFLGEEKGIEGATGNLGLFTFLLPKWRGNFRAVYANVS